MTTPPDLLFAETILEWNYYILENDIYVKLVENSWTE